MNSIDTALSLASAHGLRLSAQDTSLNEAGLDYRVVMSQDDAGTRWVLRIPRRADVLEGMAAEARILDLVRPVLGAVGVSVPDWQVRSPEVIAYPALPGSPGLTLTDAGEPVWHMDPASPDYAQRLGQLLARLHSLPVQRAVAAGVDVRTSEQVRQSWLADITQVREEFAVAPTLSQSWQAWLMDDSCWPDHTVMTHGEIYPAHVLFDDRGTITGVLDWTTARVDDPARDLAAQFGAAGAEMLQASISAYERAGGQVYPGLATQAQHLWDASPIGYALYALTTRAEEDLAAAAAMLGPEN